MAMYLHYAAIPCAVKKIGNTISFDDARGAIEDWLTKPTTTCGVSDEDGIKNANKMFEVKNAFYDLKERYTPIVIDVTSELRKSGKFLSFWETISRSGFFEQEEKPSEEHGRVFIGFICKDANKKDVELQSVEKSGFASFDVVYNCGKQNKCTFRFADVTSTIAKKYCEYSELLRECWLEAKKGPLSGTTGIGDIKRLYYGMDDRNIFANLLGKIGCPNFNELNANERMHIVHVLENLGLMSITSPKEEEVTEKPFSIQ
jgi:hypothetical protein